MFKRPIYIYECFCNLVVYKNASSFVFKLCHTNFMPPINSSLHSQFVRCRLIQYKGRSEIKLLDKVCFYNEEELKEIGLSFKTNDMDKPMYIKFINKKCRKVDHLFRYSIKQFTIK
jgi:hypothetical protein